MIPTTYNSKNDVAKVNFTINSLCEKGYTETEARLGVILTVCSSKPFITELFNQLDEETFLYTVEGTIKMTAEADISDFCPVYN